MRKPATLKLNLILGSVGCTVPQILEQCSTFIEQFQANIRFS